MATNWQIGDRIQNRWTIDKILGGPGKSGMGIVYVVFDHELREAFAAKTFQDEIFACDPAIAERFRQEAQAWVNLDIHQNVTRARFVQPTEDKPFLFLEYINGGDLELWIGTPRLTEDLPQMLRFAIQFCDGMTHALSKGIKAHRDIKPRNCLVTQDRTLKVTDFGLAKVFDDTDIGIDAGINSPSQLVMGSSRTGRGAGTPEYMAPEQFDDAKHVDVRADIYSFGVMLYQMVTGQLPFVVHALTREDAWERYRRAHQNEQPQLLLISHSTLRTIVETCLAKDPTRRFADFHAVREQLAEFYEWLTGEPAPQPVEGSPLDAVQCLNKGASLANLGRYEEAIAWYDRALELDQYLDQAWVSKANALNILGRDKEAPPSSKEEALDAMYTLRKLPGVIFGWLMIAGAWLGYRATGNPFVGILFGAHAVLPFITLAFPSLLSEYTLKVKYRTTSRQHIRLVAILTISVAIGLVFFAPKSLHGAYLGWADPFTPWVLFFGALLSLVRLGQSKGPNRSFTKPPISEKLFIWPLGVLGLLALFGAFLWHGDPITISVSKVLAGDDKGAIEILDGVIQRDSRNVMAYHNRGIARTHVGDIEGAIKDFTAEIAIKPKQADAYLLRGVALQLQGNKEEAQRDFDEFLKLNPRGKSKLDQTIKKVTEAFKSKS